MKKLLIPILPILFLFAFASPTQAQSGCDVGANIIYNNFGYFDLLRELYPGCPTITVTTMVTPEFVLENQDLFQDWLDAAYASGIELNLRLDPMGPIGNTEAEALGYILGEFINENPNNPIVGLIFNNEPNLIPGYSATEYTDSLLSFYTGLLNYFDTEQIPLPDNFTVYIAPIAIGAPNTSDYLAAIRDMLLEHPEVTDINLAMNLYAPVGSDPAAYAALVREQLAIFPPGMVSNIFISEIGLLGPDGTPIEDFSAYTQEEVEGFLTDLFGEIWDSLSDFGLDGITASFFYDSDGDGIPDQTWLVIVGPDGKVQILKFDDLRLAICVMEYMKDNPGSISQGAIDNMIDTLQAGEEINAETICQGSSDPGCIDNIGGCILYNFFLEIGEDCIEPKACYLGSKMEDCPTLIAASAEIDGNPFGINIGSPPGGHGTKHGDDATATFRAVALYVPLVREIAQRIAGTPWSAHRPFADGMLLVRLGWSGLNWRPTESVFDTERGWDAVTDVEARGSMKILGTDRKDETQGDDGRGGLEVIHLAVQEIEKALGAFSLFGGGGMAYNQETAKETKKSEADYEDSCTLGESVAKLPEFEMTLIEDVPSPPEEPEQAHVNCNIQVFPADGGCFDYLVMGQPIGDNGDLNPELYWDGQKLGLGGPGSTTPEGAVGAWCSSGYGACQIGGFPQVCPGPVDEFELCVTINVYSRVPGGMLKGECCCKIEKLSDGTWTECDQTLTPPPPGAPSCDAISGKLSKFCVSSSMNILNLEEIPWTASARWDCGDLYNEETGLWETDCTPVTTIDAQFNTFLRAHNLDPTCILRKTLGRVDLEGEPLTRGFFNNFRIPGPWFTDKAAIAQFSAGATFGAGGQTFSSGTYPRVAYLAHLGGVYETMIEFEKWISPPTPEWEGLYDLASYPRGKEETLKERAEEVEGTKMTRKVVQNPKPKETLLTKLGTGFGNLLAAIITQ